MSAARPLVWIVILNWNGLADTIACLESLRLIDTRGLDIHLLVIDNGSDVDPRPALRARFGEVEVVRLEHNRGFVGGCNLGMQRALDSDADYVMLLNNDTLVHVNFLRPLIEYAGKHPEAGVIAPLICYADRPATVWFAGATVILALGYFEHRHLNRPRHRVRDRVIRCDYATGCCMLIPKAVLNTTGLFDERFFAYFEDAELCLRIRRAGYEIVCLPGSVIWHAESASTRRDLAEGNTSPLKHFLMARNRILTVAKHANMLQLVTFLLIGNVLRSAFFLLALTLRRRWKKLAYYMRGVVAGLAAAAGRDAGLRL